MGRIVAWTPSLTGGIVVVRDPCLHGRFSIGSLCVGPSDTMSWSPTIGLLITPQEPIQPRLGGRVERLLNTYGTEVQGADQMLPRRECSAAGSALTLLRTPPSAVHGHSVRACTSSVGQRLPVDARAECLHSFGAVEQ